MDVNMLRRTFVNALFAITSLTLSGCASQAQKTPHIDDPFEGLNRATFKFNQTVDNYFIKPVSYVYLQYIPSPVQIGIGNFFDNIREVTNVANDVLQLKFAYASYDLSRLLINTTIGLGGLFDPASTLGLEHRKEDFGQTLYHWGYHHSYYIVLPFIGPSTFRDTLGLAVDYYGLSVWPWIEQGWEKYTLLGIDYLDLRARLLRRESVLDVLAVDEYAFMRDAYFQHRKYLFENSSSTSTDDIYEGVEPEDYDSSAYRKTEPQAKVEEKPAEVPAEEPKAADKAAKAPKKEGEKLADNSKDNSKTASNDNEQHATHKKKIEALELKMEALERKVDFKKDKEFLNVDMNKVVNSNAKKNEKAKTVLEQ